MSHEISPRAEKNFHIDLDIRSSSMFTINEKRHIKNLFHTIKFFFNPIKKNWNKKKQILLQLNQQTIQFIQQKNLPHLKETRHRKSHKKKPRGKKSVIVFHQVIEKINKWIKKPQIRQDIAQPYKNRSNHVQEKTESTTKQPHKRTRKKKQFSSIQQNLF